MKNLLFPIGTLLIVSLCIITGTAIGMASNGLNIFTLNFPNETAKNWKLPKGCKILYCKSLNDYQVHIPDEVFNDARLSCPKFLFMNVFLLSDIRENATSFSDSCKAKYFTKLYWEHEHPSKPDCYKPLTK